MKFTNNAALLAATALYAGEASAAAASYCIPGNDDVCFQWGVPEAAAKSGSGNVYFQMRAPTSVQWLGLGIGKRMADAEMFIMYQNGNGNVTLSPRGSANHAQPRYKERSGVQLLAGSGVVDGNMVANIKCNDCSKLDLDGSGAWLAAWKSGDSLDSTSMSASITYHDGHSQFNVNLGSASITSDSNPFVGSSDDGGSKGGDGGNDGGNSGGNNGGGSNNGDGNSGGGSNNGGGNSGNSGNGDSGNNNGGSGGAVTGTTGSSKMDMLTSAHGIVMSVVFVVMYPIGAMLMPLLGKWYLHSTWQFLGFLGMWAGFGLGYYVAHRDNIFFDQAHTRLGIFVVALLALQPIFGIIHHINYRKTQTRGIFSHIHIWYGRLLMVLGIINGGLGLKLARASRRFTIAYSVIAAIIGLLWLGASAFGIAKSKKSSPKVKSPTMSHE